MSPMKTRTLIAAAALAACFAAGAQAASYAWIGHQQGVVAIDVEGMRIVADIPRSRSVSDVAALPGGRYVYAVAFGQISKIDVEALAVVAELNDSTRSPGRIELKPGRDEAYVLEPPQLPMIGLDVHILRTDVLAYVDRIPLPVGAAGDEPAIDAARGRAFLPASGGVAEVDLASNQVLRQLAHTAMGVETHPTMRRLYVLRADTISLVDLDSGAVLASRTIGGAFLWAARVNAAGTRILVTDTNADAVHVLDAASLQTIAQLPVGADPKGIDVTPSGDRFVVVNQASGTVSFIDPATPAVVGTLTVGAMPAAYGRFIGGSSSTSATLPGPGTGLWWNPSEPGWGVHITQRRSTFFAALFHYDANRNPKWFVASNCVMPSPCPDCIEGVLCQGPVYEAGGSAFFEAPFSPSSVSTREVGVMALNFTNRNRGSMTYVVNGQHRTVNIERQLFAPSTTLSVDYTDLWWKPDESGWGLGITHQGNVMFLTWFVYDGSGQPTWLVASNCVVNANGNGCRGALYRTRGGLGPVPGPGGFDRTGFQVTEAGTIDVSFTGPNNGVISYTVGASSQTKAITRQLF